MTKKHVTLTASAFALALTLYAVAPASGVSANDGSFRENGLIQRLMEKFGLNQSEVDTVVNAYRSERQAEMQAKHQERLQQLVDEGTLTEEQKNLVQQKHNEWQNNKPDFSGMGHEERHEAMEAHKTEMEQWASENGIELQAMGMGERGGKGKGRGM
jgi:hypothetical protein